METADNRDLKYVTTREKVEKYIAISGIFPVIFVELRELYKRNPGYTLTEKKIATVNELIEEARAVLDEQPEYRFLSEENIDAESDISDLIFEFSKYKATLDRFKERHYRNIDGWYQWITPEVVRMVGGYAEGDEWDR